MAACNIQQIIFPGNAARGATPQTAPYAATDKQSDVNFFDTFVDSINNITDAINNTNCSEKLKNFAKSKLSLNIAGVKVDPTTVYDWAYDQVNLQTQLNNVVSVANSVTNGGVSDFTKMICIWAQNVALFFETALQAGLAPVLKVFQKLQEYKEKLEKAMINFTDSISRCLITVVNDVRNATNRFIQRATDFDVLIEMMDACQCIKGIIKNISGCQTDANGKPLTNSRDIVDCIQQKIGLNPRQWIEAINNFVDNTVIGGINNVHDGITNSIKIIMDLLYTPMRALARMYCNLIETKINVNFLVKKAGDFRCLLVYTTETRSNGTTYFGMNIYDILATMKLWVQCLSPVCKSFTEDIARGIKNWRDEYKLNTKYWNDVFTIDIYSACSKFREEDRRAKETTLRQIYFQGEKTSKKNFFTVIDFMQWAGIIKGADNDPSKQSYNNTANATNFNQFPIPNIPYDAAGTYVFYSGVEPLIKSVVQGLQSVTSLDYYFQKYKDLVVWTGRFVKSQDLINTMQSVDTNANVRNLITFSVNTNSNRDSFITEDIPEPTFTVPSYKLVNDYNASAVTNIQDTPAPQREIDESLSAYYKRWYSSVAV
jgi:hypothetical protein